MSKEHFTAAFERLKDHLDASGCRPVDRGSFLQALCPAHDDHEPSLTVYRKVGRVRLRDWAGCDDADILAAIGLGLRDLYDDPRGTGGSVIDPAVLARIERRRQMSPVQRAVDDLLSLDDIGERFARAVIWFDNKERFLEMEQE